VCKILGASLHSLAGLVSKEFMNLVLVSNIVAWPTAYLSMHGWLRKFAYRAEIGRWRARPELISRPGIGRIR